MRLPILCLFPLLLPLPALSQDEPAAAPAAREEAGTDRFWQAQLDAGDYVVALNRIAAIGVHEYLLDGNLVVREMTVDTGGRTTARFYHIQEVTAAMRSNGITSLAQRAGEMLERAGQRTGIQVHEMAQKNYPTTTHAGMVEFRILDLAELDALYRSLKDSWTAGRGRSIRFEREEGE